MIEIQNRKRRAGAGDSVSVIPAPDSFRVSETTSGDRRPPAGGLSTFVLRAFSGAHDTYYRHFAWKVVRKHVSHGRPKRDDRRVLEEVIIPFVLSRFEPRTILDVGRESYEALYNEFFVGRELWTIDCDAIRSRFGAPNHITDDVANLQDHFPERNFDFVLMNGVFGWGLHGREGVGRAFAAIHTIPSPRGVFVLGWNDMEDLIPVPLDEVQSLKRFTPYLFEPLNGTAFKCSTFKHTYNFYAR